MIVNKLVIEVYLLVYVKQLKFDISLKMRGAGDSNKGIQNEINGWLKLKISIEFHQLWGGNYGLLQKPQNRSWLTYIDLTEREEIKIC